MGCDLKGGVKLKPLKPEMYPFKKPVISLWKRAAVFLSCSWGIMETGPGHVPTLNLTVTMEGEKMAKLDRRRFTEML